MTTSKIEFDAYQRRLGKLTAHCELVKNGVKPASELTLPFSMFEEIIRIIESDKLSYSTNKLDDFWCQIYIYKHKHIKDVLNGLHAASHLFDDTTRHWVWGKMFGFSEHEIGVFIAADAEKRNNTRTNLVPQTGSNNA